MSKTLAALLTDGVSVVAIKQIDRLSFDQEIAKLSKHAQETTGGELRWVDDKRGYQGSATLLGGA